MHAFIVDSPQLTVHSSIDTLVIEPDTSIGIEEVRQIQHFLSRKPIQSDHNTVVIHQAHLLTIPAQNALLKILEEPPGQAQLYLVTDYPDQLIPTVLSRVQILTSPNLPNSPNLSNASRLLKKLLAAPVGERFKLTEDQAFTRATALEFLDHLERLIHEQIRDPSPHLEGGGSLHLPGESYNLIMETRKYLKANCNVKLCLDYLVINL